jgi:hypothetical protein
MPSMHRRSKAVLDDIYAEYGVATVPLAIDLSEKDDDWTSVSSGSEYEDEKPLPPPPRVTDPDTVPSAIGRRGFGVDGRSKRTSPLNPKPTRAANALSRRPALRQSSRTASTDSNESIWFASASPPRSTYSSAVLPRIITTDFDSDTSGYDTPPQSDSFSSFWNGSTDTWMSARSRLRIFLHDSTAPTQEIFVGPLYEVISYIWDTISHPQNVKSLTSLFSDFAIPRSNVINLVASSSLSLEHFLSSTELQVHINTPSKPRYTSLDNLEIQLNNDLIHALNTAHESNVQQIKALIRVAMIYQVGEYIHNHVLIRDGLELMISPSIDLVRAKETRGGNVAVVGMFGGLVSFRWRCGRVEVLLRVNNEVYRVPERIVTEMYRSVKVNAFQLGELDL